MSEMTSRGILPYFQVVVCCCTQFCMCGCHDLEIQFVGMMLPAVDGVAHNIPYLNHYNHSSSGLSKRIASKRI